MWCSPRVYFGPCFNNKLEINFLPVYNPSQKEEEDPKLFVRNVGAEIAKYVNFSKENECGVPQEFILGPAVVVWNMCAEIAESALGPARVKQYRPNIHFFKN